MTAKHYFRDMPIRQRLECQSIPEPNSGCWLWSASVNHSGYGLVLYLGKQRLAHRVSFAIFTGVDPGEDCVLHRCDVPACINPDHLFLGSRADNVADKVSKGRQCRGETSWQSKLTAKDVTEIRAAFSARTGSKWGGRRFARLLGVTDQAIDAVARGKSWRIVPAPPPAAERTGADRATADVG